MQITNIRNERGGINTDIIDIKWIVNECINNSMPITLIA